MSPTTGLGSQASIRSTSFRSSMKARTRNGPGPEKASAVTRRPPSMRDSTVALAAWAALITP